MTDPTPLDSLRKAAVEATHAKDCAAILFDGRPLHTCGGTYTCNRCERAFGWCLGCCDDTPALCDECAVLVQGDDHG